MKRQLQTLSTSLWLPTVFWAASAHADIPPANLCWEVGATCYMDGGAEDGDFGVCTKSTCGRVNYNPNVDGSFDPIVYDCLLCKRLSEQPVSTTTEFSDADIRDVRAADADIRDGRAPDTDALDAHLSDADTLQPTNSDARIINVADANPTPPSPQNSGDSCTCHIPERTSNQGLSLVMLLIGGMALLRSPRRR